MACCERDYDNDGNCDRHYAPRRIAGLNPALSPETIEDILQVMAEEAATDFTRASQDALCIVCNVRLGDHPMAEEILSYRDCTGRLWKL